MESSSPGLTMKTHFPPNTEMIFRELTCSIGGTPLLAIQCRFRGHLRTIYVKSESQNLTGSIKDRVALHVLWTAYQRGMLKPGYAIAEGTGGNTGLAFAAVGRALGHPVTVFLSDKEPEERKTLVQRFGGTVAAIGSGDCEGLEGLRGAEEMAEETGAVFLPHRSFGSVSVEAHERSTGPELWYQLKARGSKPDAFVAGVGTGGTVMGVGRFLGKMDSAIRVHPIEVMDPLTSATECGPELHRIPGLSPNALPGVMDSGGMDRVIQVSDGDAILMARALDAQLGLGLGISSGANFLGALLVQKELGPEAVVATVFPDDNRRYPNIDLFGDEPVRDGFISPDVELSGYDSFRRSCRACDDVDECQPWMAEAGP